MNIYYQKFINFLTIHYLYDEETLLINIHEYIHGLIFYKKLGKKYNNWDSNDILPMLYEQIYIIEK